MVISKKIRKYVIFALQDQSYALFYFWTQPPMKPDMVMGNAKTSPESGRFVGPARKGRFLLNLGSLLLLGVLGLGWIGYYTDYLPIVGNLLGLGGAFAWIAFLSGMVTQARKMDVQADVDQILTSSGTTYVLSILGFVFLIWFGSVGTLQIKTDGIQREAHVTDRKPLFLAPNLNKKLWFFVPPPFFGRKQVRVHIRGLPFQEWELGTMRRLTKTIPHAFYRRVMLIRPHPETTSNALVQGAADTVRLFLNGKPMASPAPFKGQAIWVGCGPDVPVPKNLKALWELEISDEPSFPQKKVLAEWYTPLANDIMLREGDRIRIEIRNKQGETIVEEAMPLFPSEEADDFIQEWKLRKKWKSGKSDGL